MPLHFSGKGILLQLYKAKKESRNANIMEISRHFFFFSAAQVFRMASGLYLAAMLKMGPAVTGFLVPYLDP